MIIYSRSAEYAIRAFVYLAEVPEDDYAMAKVIAEKTDIPSHFLAKILQQLARKGFLRSNKGPRGGFILRRPAADITLLQLVDAIDGLSEYEHCPGGMSECNDKNPCGMHETWSVLRSRIIQYLEETTIADVVMALQKKRWALARQPKRPRISKKK